MMGLVDRVFTPKVLDAMRTIDPDSVDRAENDLRRRLGATVRCKRCHRKHPRRADCPKPTKAAR